MKGEQIETRFQKCFGPIVFGSFLRSRIFVIPRFRGVSKVRETFINDVVFFFKKGVYVQFNIEANDVVYECPKYSGLIWANWKKIRLDLRTVKLGGHGHRLYTNCRSLES